MSSSSQFRSVLDSGVRNSSPKICADRITRRRSPSRNRDDDDEEVVVPRVAQAYRTSLSAVAAPIRMKKSERSRSVSPGGSLISGRSRSKSPGNRRSSPKRVTYDERVTVRHSDTEDSLVTDLSGRDSGPDHSPQDPGKSEQKISPVEKSPEERHAAELRQTCLEITNWYSRPPSQSSSSPGSTMDRLQVTQPHYGGSSPDQSTDFFTSSPGRGDSGVYTDGETVSKQGKTNIEKDYNHDRTISYRMAIKAHYSDEVKQLAAANMQEICPPMIVTEPQTSPRSPVSPSSDVGPRVERSNTLPTNTANNSDHNLSVSKKTVSSSIGNFFRKISPRMSRREKHGRSSSSGSAQSLDTSTNESNQSLDRSRGSKRRRSFLKFIGKVRSRSHSRSKSSDQEENSPVVLSPNNTSLSPEPRNPANPSMPNSSQRILKSIEQNKDTDKSVYQRFKEKQVPVKGGQLNQSNKCQALKVSPETSPISVDPSTTGHVYNKENLVVNGDLLSPGEKSKAEPPHSLNVRQTQRPLLKTIQPSYTSMGSCDESIGDCSLDINLEGSEPALLNTSQVSTSASKQVILSQDHLDCPGISPNQVDSPIPGDTLVTPPGMQLSHPPNIGGLENGALSKHSSPSSDMPRLSTSCDISPRDPGKVPSYLKLSCAVSGYGMYSSYSSRKDIHIAPSGNSVTSLRSDSSGSDSQLRTTNATRAASLPLNFTKNHLAEVKSIGHLNGQLNDVLTNGHAGVYPTGDVTKDGEYYLSLCQTEEERLMVLCSQAKGDMGETSIPEEANGRIRAAIGKTNLLITKKFKQFRGLCQKHMNPDGKERETKWEDLQGFWDMVKIQIDDLDELFAEIAFMRQNEWKDVPRRLQSARSSANSSPKSPSVSLSSTPSQTPGHTPGHTPASRRKPVNLKDTPDSSPEKSLKSREKAKAREDARKRMLAEKRAAMKQQKLKTQEKITPQEVEIFLPDGAKN